MDFTLDSFASECRRILKEDPSPVGRGKVRELVQEVLKDQKFLASLLPTIVLPTRRGRTLLRSRSGCRLKES